MIDLVILKSVLKWLLYLVIGSIAIFFIHKGEAIDQYKSYATNFKKKEIPVSERPVVTICPVGIPRKYKYGVDFNITVGRIVAKLGNNSFKCSEVLSPMADYDYYSAYDDCDYNASDISFSLESIYKFWRNMTCYKVIYDPSNIYDEDIPFQVVFVFGDSIPYEELPENIHVYLTSNDNSHGVIFNTWTDGNELSLKFQKVL